MTDTKDLKFPTIHLNGTSGQDLFDATQEAWQAVTDALAKMQAAMPHDRDYYPQALSRIDGPGVVARTQMRSRMLKLEAVQDELAQIVINISDQNYEISKRREKVLARSVRAVCDAGQASD